MANFDPPHLENRSTDFDEIETYNYLPKTTRHARPHIDASTWMVWANTQFATVSFFPCLFFFFLFLRLTHRSHQWIDLHQNWHVSAVSAKDVPFGGLNDDQSRLGVLTPKTQHFGGVNRHFKPTLQKNQIPISSKLCIRLAQNLTG